MPTGSGSGIVHSVTFTPDSAGRVVVTCTYEAEGDAGSAWGASYNAKAFLTQDGSTVLGEASGVSNDRTPGIVRGVFDVVAGEEVVCGLWGAISGAVDATFWNINVTAELIKR